MLHKQLFTDASKGFVQWLECGEAQQELYVGREPGGHTNAESQSRGRGSLHFDIWGSGEREHKQQNDKDMTARPDSSSTLRWHTLSEGTRNSNALLDSSKNKWQSAEVWPHSSKRKWPSAGDERESGIQGAAKLWTQKSGQRPPWGVSTQSQDNLHSSIWQSNGHTITDDSSLNREVKVGGQTSMCAEHYQKILDSWAEDSNSARELIELASHSIGQNRHRHHHHKGLHHHHTHHQTPNNHHQAHNHHKNSRTQSNRRLHSISTRVGQGHTRHASHLNNAESNDVWFRVPGDITVKLSKL